MRCTQNVRTQTKLPRAKRPPPCANAWSKKPTSAGRCWASCAAGPARWTLAPAAVPLPLWEDRIVERSGVGVGTTPCFACQGRIANLGALAVATPEGDKQTFSIWRCRTCYTCYLNDLIDRAGRRTDSLETESVLSA